MVRVTRAEKRALSRVPPALGFRTEHGRHLCVQICTVSKVGCAKDFALYPGESTRPAVWVGVKGVAVQPVLVLTSASDHRSGVHKPDILDPVCRGTEVLVQKANVGVILVHLPRNRDTRVC